MISTSNNIYLISYASATCGNFVMLVLWSLLEHPEGFHIFSKHGNAHLFNPYKENWKVDRASTEWKNYHKIVDYNNHLYRLVKPLDDTKPLLLSGHKFPDFEEFFEMYPNAKLIFIQHSKEDIEHLKKLFYYKIPVDMLQLNMPFEEAGIDYVFETINYLPEFIDVDIPEKYKDRTCIIEFRDILNEDSALLETLGKFVDKKVTEGIRSMHKNYLDKQPIDLSFAKI